MLNFGRTLIENQTVLFCRLTMGDERAAKFFGKQASGPEMLEFYERHPRQTKALVTAYLTPDEPTKRVLADGGETDDDEDQDQ